MPKQSRPTAAERLAAVLINDPFQLMSVRHVSLLLLLDRTGESSVTEAGEALGVQKSVITYAVRRLEADGLAVHRPNPTNGREKIIRLTSAGRRAIAKLIRTL